MGAPYAPQTPHSAEVERQKAEALASAEIHDFELSTAQGQPVAKTEMDRLAAKMTPNQIAEAQRLAREWKPTTPSPSWRFQEAFSSSPEVKV